MSADALAPRPRRHALISLLLWAALSVALALLVADVVRLYFPYAEEWKILLPSWPGLANPADWFRGFAATMSEPYPAWSVAAINFLRPVMNGMYWLRGVVLGENWGAQLYFNFPLVAGAVAALYYSLRMPAAAAAGPLLAGALAAAFLVMPPMLSGASYFLPVLLPQMPFDALITALYLLGCVAYLYARYLLTALLVLAALMTKEQAVTLAAAVPAVFAWTHRHRWRDAWPTLLLLSVPLLLWLTMRLTLFGSVSGGVYVLLREPLEILRATIVSLLRLPLYAPSAGSLLRDPLSWQGVLVVANLTVLAYIALDIVKRWRQQGPDVIAVTAVFGWGFLALVGMNPRYGGIVIAPVIWMAARPAVVGMPRIARPAALAALGVTALVHLGMSVGAFGTHAGFLKGIYDVGRSYAAALEQADTETVVVLNDPSTPWTAPADMARVLRLPVTDIVKASDYPWRWPSSHAREVPDQSCRVTVERLDAQRIAMQQSCGLLLMGAQVPRDMPLRLPLAPGVTAEFPEPGFEIAQRGVRVGERMILHVTRPGVAVLYFKPSSRTFHWVPQ